MEKFYAIRVINVQARKRGYLISLTNGILLSRNISHPDIIKFSAYDSAEKFIKEEPLLNERGILASIRDNEDLM